MRVDLATETTMIWPNWPTKRVYAVSGSPSGQADSEGSFRSPTVGWWGRRTGAGGRWLPVHLSGLGFSSAGVSRRRLVRGVSGRSGCVPPGAPDSVV